MNADDVMAGTGCADAIESICRAVCIEDLGRALAAAARDATSCEDVVVRVLDENARYVTVASTSAGFEAGDAASEAEAAEYDAIAGERPAVLSDDALDGPRPVALAPIVNGGRKVGMIVARNPRGGMLDVSSVEHLERMAGFTAARFEEEWRRHRATFLAEKFDDRRHPTEVVVALGELASTIAHELKNPLAGMMLSASRLKKALQAIEGQERLSAIADHLIGSVNTMTDRITAIAGSVEEPRLELGRVDLNDVIEFALMRSKREIASNRISIRRDFAALPGIYGDGALLARAVANLFANAIDAMPEGGTLSVSALRAGDEDVEIVVRDTGPGISPERADALFEPFRSRNSSQGLGLGLAVVRRIAEMHSGGVEVRTAPEGGAEAVMRLPVMPDRFRH